MRNTSEKEVTHAPAVLLLLIGVLAVCTPALPAPTRSDVDANTLRNIRTVDTAGPFRESGVEVELYSARAFPVRNEIAVLQIGRQAFLRSRYPESGDTHVLIFFLTPQEFARLTNGDPVSVRYGLDPGGSDRWEFGALDKGRLDRR